MQTTDLHKCGLLLLLYIIHASITTEDFDQ